MVKFSLEDKELLQSLLENYDTVKVLNKLVESLVDIQIASLVSERLDGGENQQFILKKARLEGAQQLMFALQDSLAASKKKRRSSGAVSA